MRYHALTLAAALALTLGVGAQPAITPMDPAPEGYQWVELASIAVDSAVEDFNAVASPDLVVGDHLLMPTVTTPGNYSIDLFTDGHIEYDDGEDGSRQTADGWAWDTSAAAWHAQSFDYIANNIDPVGGAPIESALLVDAAMTEIDLNEYFVDGEGDTLTITLTSGTPPTGVSLAAGVISGTPTVEDEDGVTLVYTADDGYGGTGTQTVFLRPLVTLPASDCTTDETSQSDCELEFGSDFSGTISFDVTTEYHETIPFDMVISQSPVAGAEMAPYTTVELLVSLGACTPAVWANGLWAVGFWADGLWGESDGCEPEPVAVPDVTVDSLAEADVVLEAFGLDTGTTTAVCSLEAENEVVGQNPAAGALVVLGSAVNLTYSNGVECEYDLTGIPIGWYSVQFALADQEFIVLMRDEATNGGADWAYWLPGVPRNTANLRLDMAVIQAEATSGGADWARWAPGTQPGNTGNLQLNMQEALNADFL
jgi:hypothetical protein